MKFTTAMNRVVRAKTHKQLLVVVHTVLMDEQLNELGSAFYQGRAAEFGGRVRKWLMVHR